MKPHNIVIGLLCALAYCQVHFTIDCNNRLVAALNECQRHIVELEMEVSLLKSKP